MTQFAVIPAGEARGMLKVWSEEARAAAIEARRANAKGKEEAKGAFSKERIATYRTKDYTFEQESAERDLAKLFVKPEGNVKEEIKNRNLMSDQITAAFNDSNDLNRSTEKGKWTDEELQGLRELSANAQEFLEKNPLGTVHRGLVLNKEQLSNLTSGKTMGIFNGSSWTDRVSVANQFAVSGAEGLPGARPVILSIENLPVESVVASYKTNAKIWDQSGVRNENETITRGFSLRKVPGSKVEEAWNGESTVYVMKVEVVGKVGQRVGKLPKAFGG